MQRNRTSLSRFN